MELLISRRVTLLSVHVSCVSILGLVHLGLHSWLNFPLITVFFEWKYRQCSSVTRLY